MLLNCDTLEYEYVPFNLDGLELVIINSNKQRVLAESKYNERRLECEKALGHLKSKFDIKYLCDIEEENIENALCIIEDEVLKSRSKHVISENIRAKKAMQYMKKLNMKKLGKLLNYSHVSLSKDYEVTGIELDTLFEASKKQEDCLGARMTGAGFGGCAIALVESEKVNNFIGKVGKEYFEKTGLKVDFYITKTGVGAQEIK